MNPDQLIELYESNRYEFARALKKAGGDPDIIFIQKAWREVMMTLARNNISITAQYNGAELV